MQAPLGRAVIGGLVMSTFATLLFVPSIFAIVIGKKTADSPSIHPADPEADTTVRAVRYSRPVCAFGRPTAPGENANGGGHEPGPSHPAPGGP